MYKKIASLILIISLINTLYASQLLDQPGEYNFGNGLTYTPTFINDSIVLITSSNVLLDLRHNILMQQPGDTTGGLNGITISPNLHNVTIQNGTLQSMTGAGILVGDGCSGIKILNMKIQGCNTTGVLFNGSTVGINIGLVDGCNIFTCTGSNGNPAYGLRIIKGSNIYVTGSLFAFNDGGTVSSGFGASIENSAECVFGQIIASDNGGSGLAAGMAFVNSQDCIVENCISKKNVAHDLTGSGSACGYYKSNCSNILFNLCSTNHNINSAGYGAFGDLDINSTSCVCRDSTYEFNQGAQKSAGICLVGTTDQTIEKCIVRSNTSTAGTAYGIYLQGTNNSCLVSQCTLKNNIGVSSSFGIRDDLASSTSFFLQNIAFNNGTNYTINYPLTISLPVITGSLSNVLVGLPGNRAVGLDNVNVTP